MCRICTCVSMRVGIMHTICLCIHLGVYECSCLCSCEPCVYIQAMCVLVFFKGDGVALVQPKLACVQPRRGLVRVGKGPSSSKSPHVPSWILLCKSDANEGLVFSPLTNSPKADLLRTFGLSQQLETGGKGGAGDIRRIYL